VEPIVEQVEIAAPVERVWRVVHQEIEAVPLWSENLVRCEVLGGGPVATGSRLRYMARLPLLPDAEMLMHVERYEEFTCCAGQVTGPGLHGHWEWRYRTKAGRTVVVYETQVEVTAMLRLLARSIEGEVRADVRRNLDALKRYVEKGTG
jgi:uncharacterized membrane protein